MRTPPGLMASELQGSPPHLPLAHTTTRAAVQQPPWHFNKNFLYFVFSGAFEKCFHVSDVTFGRCWQVEPSCGLWGRGAKVQPHLQKSAKM